jgi:ABC-type phosphate/phosphonate transport system substrate-binding protein
MPKRPHTFATSPNTSALPFRRALCSSLGFGALLLGAPAWAQTPSPRKTQASSVSSPPWRLLINEAVAGEVNGFVLTNRYRPFGEFLTAQLKGRPISIQPVISIKSFMTLAQENPKPELVYGKSVNQIAKLVRDQGYQPLVRRSDPFKAAFIVPKGSPIRTLVDAAHAKIVMPDEFAAITAVARAELRRQNVLNTNIVNVQYQESVTQYLQTGIAQIGAVNPAIARKWTESGGRIVAETQPVASWSMLASPKLSADSVRHLQEELLSMNAQATSIMTGLGVKEWAKAERQDYLALLDYIKE